MEFKENNKSLYSKLQEMDVPLRAITQQFMRKEPLNDFISGSAVCKRADIRGALILADILEAGYSPVYILRSTNKKSDEEIRKDISNMFYKTKIHFISGEELLGTREIYSPDYYFARLD